LFLVGSGRPMNVSSLRSDPGVTRDAFEGNAALLNEMRRYVDQNVPPWRFDTLNTTMEWTYGAPILQIPSAAGISPLALENAIQLRLFLHDGYRWGWNYPLENLDSPIVDLLNVRYIITRAEDVPRLAAIPKFRQLARLPGNELFENTGVFPRFFLVHQARAVASLKEARDLISRHQVDLRQNAIVDQPMELASGGGSDEVKTLSYEPNALELSVQTSRGGLLVLSETYYPGWKAWLDDQPTPIYCTDIALRGVLVPAGTHRVRMEFRPLILPIALGISLITAILLAISAFVYRKSARRIQLN
jgi:Bacterial membrane protein YfhO